MRGGFFAAASPQLDELVRDVTKEVPEPDHPGKTIFDVWNGTEVRLRKTVFPTRAKIEPDAD